MPTFEELQRMKELELKELELKKEKEKEFNPFDGKSFGWCGTNLEPGVTDLDNILERVGLFDSITADHIVADTITTSKLSFVPYVIEANNLDDINDGDKYSRVLKTDITAGHVLLTSITGDLDDISDGTIYGKVALTGISAGKIVVAGLDSGVTAKMFTDSTTKNNVEAWKHASDVTLIDGGDIYTNTITADAIAANTITVGQVDFDAQLFTDGTTKTNVEGWKHTSDVTKIDGGDIYTNTITATQIAANTVTVGEVDFDSQLFTDGTTKTNIEAWRHGSDVTKIDGGDIYARSITTDRINVGSPVNYNVALGINALDSWTSGSYNIAIAEDVLTANTTGSYNIGIGHQSLKKAITDNYNVGIGYQCLYTSNGGEKNTALGYKSLYANTTGDHNVAIGTNALDANTTGSGNVAIGQDAMGACVATHNNTAVGSAALYNDAGTGNTAIGHAALANLTSGGYSNTAVGEYALNACTSGDANVCLGVNAGLKVTTGSSNTLVGLSAGEDITTGSDNVLIGYLAGGNLTTTGDNVCVGINAGRLLTGSGCVCLGHDAGAQETFSNKLYIANSNTTTPLIFGEFDTHNLGINTRSFGGGTLVIGIKDVAEAPSSNPTAGGILYVDSGALKYRGSSGTITTIANA